jgi:hypothetical protein
LTSEDEAEICRYSYITENQSIGLTSLRYRHLLKIECAQRISHCKGKGKTEILEYLSVLGHIIVLKNRTEYSKVLKRLCRKFYIVEPLIS